MNVNKPLPIHLLKSLVRVMLLHIFIRNNHLSWIIASNTMVHTRKFLIFLQSVENIIPSRLLGYLQVLFKCMAKWLRFPHRSPGNNLFQNLSGKRTGNNVSLFFEPILVLVFVVNQSLGTELDNCISYKNGWLCVLVSNYMSHENSRE